MDIVINDSDDSDPSKQVAEAFRAIRTEKGLSMQDIADTIGVTRQAVNDFETAERKKTLEQLKRWFNALEVQARLVIDESS